MKASIRINYPDKPTAFPTEFSTHSIAVYEHALPGLGVLIDPPIIAKWGLMNGEDISFIWFEPYNIIFEFQEGELPTTKVVGFFFTLHIVIC